ncbi:hypothetical protein EYR38_003114 [Pleurotus pulmonarius]|nr:hypothetical protein EYR38_003114 [Pleurotus pulmonarius]
MSKAGGPEADTEYLSATITHNAGISIGGEIDIPNAFNRGVNLRVSQEEPTKFHEDAVSLSHDWSVIVEPGQHLRLVRKKTTMSGTQEFEVPYGLANTPEDRIATNERPLSATLNAPSKVMLITCILRKEEYVYVLQDIAADDIVRKKHLFHGNMRRQGCKL